MRTQYQLSLWLQVGHKALDGLHPLRRADDPPWRVGQSAAAGPLPICHPVMPKVFPAELTWRMAPQVSEDPDSEGALPHARQLGEVDVAFGGVLLRGQAVAGRVEDHVLVDLKALCPEAL